MLPELGDQRDTVLRRRVPPAAWARALALVRNDVTYPGHRNAQGLQLGALDTDWLRLCGTSGWLVITRDRRIRTKPVELQAILDHRVRAVVLTGKRDQSSWERLLLLARAWPQFENLLARPGPWLHGLDTRAQLRPLNLSPR